jgi:hypothetical protein
MAPYSIALLKTILQLSERIFRSVICKYNALHSGRVFKSF